MSRKFKKRKIFIERRRQRNLETRKESAPSVPEQMIINFLVSNCVSFSREKHFGGFINPTSKCHLFFDFYIPKYNLVIEYDGRHHFDPIYGEKKFKEIKDHDFKKNVYCAKNKINILRIPFYKKDKIEELICLKIDELESKKITHETH